MDYTGNLLGGLAQGFATGKGQAKDRALNEEFKKVLMEQHKLQGKMLESKMKEMEVGQGLMGPLMQSLTGGGMPGAAGSPGGASPASQDPRDMNQGQKTLIDMLIHKYGGGFDPGLRKDTGIKTFGDPATGIIGARPGTGQVMWQIPGVGKVELKEVTNPDGSRSYQPVPVPPAGGGAMPQGMPPGGPLGSTPPDFRGGPAAPAKPQYPGTLAAPAPADTPPPISEKGREGWTALQDTLASLTNLEGIVKKAETDKKEIFGYWESGRHNAYQDPNTFMSAVKRATVFSKEPTPELTAFRSELEKYVAALRKAVSGQALSESEAANYQRQALAATTPETFRTVVAQHKREIAAKQNQLHRELTLPPGRRMQEDTIMTTAPLGSGKRHPQTGDELYNQLMRD